MKKAPEVLTRMKLSCCWGDNLNEKELNDVVDYINELEQENKSLQSQLKSKEEVIKEAINYIDNNTYYKDHKGHINIDDLYIILQKGSDNNE